MRKLAFERDRVCLKCGSIENLVAHHILPKSLYPDQTFDLENLSTLCCTCHVRLHKNIPISEMSPDSGYFEKWIEQKMD